MQLPPSHTSANDGATIRCMKKQPPPSHTSANGGARERAGADQCSIITDPCERLAAKNVMNARQPVNCTWYIREGKVTSTNLKMIGSKLALRPERKPQSVNPQSPLKTVV